MELESTKQSAFGQEVLAGSKFEDYLQKPYFYT